MGAAPQFWIPPGTCSQDRMGAAPFYPCFLCFFFITHRSFSVLRGGPHSIFSKRRPPENSEILRFFLALPPGLAKTTSQVHVCARACCRAALQPANRPYEIHIRFLISGATRQLISEPCTDHTLEIHSRSGPVSVHSFTTALRPR